MKRKVCVVVGSRANYSSAKPMMSAIQRHEALELQTIVAASGVLDRYGSVIDMIEADGFEVAAQLHMLIEGETPATMAKSTGLGLIELPTIFENLRPNIVVSIGDRFETMSTAIAAAYMNIPLAHTMGGEVSGTIDESIRHAVTKLAHIHFPATKEAYDRIIKLGEMPGYVFHTGCPRIDLVEELLELEAEINVDELFRDGVGGHFDVDKPFLIVSQHPVTTEYGAGEFQMTETLEAIKLIDLPAFVLWPNADAGADDVARGLRKWRERSLDGNMRFYKNQSMEVYTKLMSRTACLVGNSSSGIREGSFIGTPVVNVGSRQRDRERGENVMDVGYDRFEIADAIRKQIANGKYRRSFVYGTGQAGEKIAEILATVNVQVQKRLSY